MEEHNMEEHTMEEHLHHGKINNNVNNVNNDLDDRVGLLRRYTQLGKHTCARADVSEQSEGEGRGPCRTSKQKRKHDSTYRGTRQCTKTRSQLVARPTHTFAFHLALSASLSLYKHRRISTYYAATEKICTSRPFSPYFCVYDVYDVPSVHAPPPQMRANR